MIEVIGSSAFAAAVLFGLRHGFDWDHIAALTDLTGSQRSARRAMRLASLYALGHACMVLLLGAGAILLAEQLPAGVDSVMDRVVGASLILLAVWIVTTAARTGSAPPLRSRWMLLIGMLRHFSSAPASENGPVVIEHAHPHDHHAMHAHPHGIAEPAEVVSAQMDGPAATSVVGVASLHSHVHHHLALPPVDPFLRYGSWSSFGIGLLHGVGAETPTQLLVFAAAASADGRATSMGLLLCFLVGLLASNTLVAGASTLGFRGVLRHRAVAASLAGVTALFSLIVGTMLLLGRTPAIPGLLGG